MISSSRYISMSAFHVSDSVYGNKIVQSRDNKANKLQILNNTTTIANIYVCNNNNNNKNNNRSSYHTPSI